MNLLLIVKLGQQALFFFNGIREKDREFPPSIIPNLHWPAKFSFVVKFPYSNTVQ